jgi:hypothetical protein
LEGAGLRAGAAVLVAGRALGAAAFAGVVFAAVCLAAVVLAAADGRLVAGMNSLLGYSLKKYTKYVSSNTRQVNHVSRTGNTRSDGGAGSKFMHMFSPPSHPFRRVVGVD